MADNDLHEMERQMAEQRLVLTGLLVNDLVKKIKGVVAESPLDEERLKEFEAYASRIEAVGWVFDPTGYRDLLYQGGFERYKARQKFVRAVLEFCASEASEPPNEE